MVSLPIVNLWDKRSALLYFAWSNIKIRFKATYLGFVWTALEPMMYFVVLYVVFTSIRASTREDFAIYLITGIMIYHIFLRGSAGGLVSLKSNESILYSYNIKREFFPVASTLSTTILLFVEVAVFFFLMPFFGFIPSITIVFLPIILFLLLALVLGLSYILSITFLYIRDIHPLWMVFTQVLFFLSPIFWYLKDVGGIMLEIQKINPVGQLIELAHKIVFGEIPPLNEWLYTSAIIFGILFVGYALFRKLEKNVVEVM